MPSTAERDDHHGSRPGPGPGRLHVPALRQLYTRVSLRGRRKSTITTATEDSSSSSVSSRPVVVRTYSPKRPSASRSPSSAREDQRQRLITSNSAAMHARSRPDLLPAHLPPPADFSFAGILHAVEPEISGAIDAIAAICARSRLCLADEYAAHRPPHEVLDPANPIPLPPPAAQQGQRNSSTTRWWSVVRDTALAAVPEASSSSERLTGSRTASRASLSSSTAGQSAKGGGGGGAGKKTMTTASSAYGSLKSFVSGGGGGEVNGSGQRGGRRKGLAALFSTAGEGLSSSSSSSHDLAHAQWMVVRDDGDDSGAIRLLCPATASPPARAASPRLSLAVSEDPLVSSSLSPSADAVEAAAKPTPPTTPFLHPSSPGPPSNPTVRSRASSSPGWFSSSWNHGHGHGHDGANVSAATTSSTTAAQQRLKWLLEASAAVALRATQQQPLVKTCSMTDAG